MKNFLVRLFLLLAFLSPAAALAQGNALVVTTCGTLPLAYTAGSQRPPTVDVNGVNCIGNIVFGGYPTGATPITGNAAGTTGAVVGTLAGTSGKTTYICGFNVQAIGGTSTVGPITVAGLTGSSQVYQTDVNSATVGKTVASGNFAPCIPANAVNTGITITTTADGTASAVNVNSWGYQQ